MVKPEENAQRVQTIHLQKVWDTINIGHRNWRAGDPRTGDPTTGTQ